MVSILDEEAGGCLNEVDFVGSFSSTCCTGGVWFCRGGAKDFGLVLTLSLTVGGDKLSTLPTDTDDSEDRLGLCLGLDGLGLGLRAGAGLVDDLCWKGVGLLLSELSSESTIRDLLR